MKRYKVEPIRIAPPIDGFLIKTPDERILYDTRPKTITKELNRLLDLIKRMEEAGDRLVARSDIGNASAGCLDAVNQWNKAKEAKP